VALDVGLCERCNPLGLRDSASSQVHGTVFVAVALGIVGLALAARFAVAGIGPFSAAIAGMTDDGTALVVQLQVTNTGTATGSTTCRITDPAMQGSGQPIFVLSPRIEPKATVSFEKRLVGMPGPVRALAVDCPAP
jgi:hypothetical protein